MLDVVDCLMDLLAIPSVTGQENAVARHVAQVLRATFPDADVDVQDLGDGGANVLMRSGVPAVVLTSHLDTVPGAIAPRADATTIWGRGACDAKGQIAAQLCALERAAARGARDLGCFFVCGEEVDSRGARAALEHPFARGSLAINGEPTTLRFVTRSWGLVELELRAHGRAAHSSTSSGVPATHALVRDLEALLQFAADDRKVNIGVVSGGVASNVTAPEASAFVCIRLRENPEALIAEIRERVQSCDVEVREVIHPAVFEAPAGAPTTEVLFASDAAFYARRFDRVMEFGPGDIEDAHTPDEHVRVADLRRAVDVLADLLWSAS